MDEKKVEMEKMEMKKKKRKRRREERGGKILGLEGK